MPWMTEEANEEVLKEVCIATKASQNFLGHVTRKKKLESIVMAEKFKGKESEEGQWTDQMVWKKRST